MFCNGVIKTQYKNLAYQRTLRSCLFVSEFKEDKLGDAKLNRKSPLKMTIKREHVNDTLKAEISSSSAADHKVLIS